MQKPRIHMNNPDGIVEREMTEEEYADLLASGWTLESQEEIPTE